MSFIEEAIAGAALSSLFDALFAKLKSSELLNLFTTEGQVHEEIMKWEEKLEMLRFVLEDAEEKQIQNKVVKKWLGDLKHLAYDVEDILDEFSYDCLHRNIVSREVMEEQPKKILRLNPLALFSSSTSMTTTFSSDMMSKIREITAKFDGLMEKMEKLELVKHIRETSSKVWQRPSSTSLPDENEVYGRDGDKNKILELLHRYETGDANVDVIPIVGMGGMGKTTLAKLVYNDNSRQDHFQVKAWVCVSDVFDIMRVTKEILESITSQSCDLKGLNHVQKELNEKLAGKKFLLVLDDVWTKNPADWHDLCPPLMNGAPGSKVIVTTRSSHVAGMMRTTEYLDLTRISDEDCWLLFAKHAFQNRATVVDPDLEKVGRDIVSRRCGGLPLAARTLGGLLRSKQSHSEWEKLLNNKLWSVLDGRDNIMSVLKLSYYHLPAHLKRCFTYCAIFPKDYEFEEKETILLWMADGLIPQRDNKLEMETLGGDYFHDLLSRSFFQASNANKSRFIMHDLLSDIAEEFAEDTYFRLEDEVNGGDEFKRKRARHNSYIQHHYDGVKRFAPFCMTKCLRTFLPFSLESYREDCYLSKCVPLELLENLKFLRVLSFSHYNIKELPNPIGGLKHLRYLDLAHTQIEVLPESTTSLYNLQTLILEGCRSLQKLPARMDKWKNLYYLNIRGAEQIEGMPLEMEELRDLQILSNFVVGVGSFTITTLMSLNSLRGEICISNLNYVACFSDARNSKLMDKEGICGLDLRWNENNTYNDIQDGGVHYDVLDGLQPHKNLEKLIISNYGGTRFPSWIGDPTYNNILHLRLEGCKKCTMLPQLGVLPSLKEMFVIKMSGLQRVDQEFYGNSCNDSFPSLEVLCFQDMDDWEEWNACNSGFKVLRELLIGNCRRLSGKLCIHPSSLEKLVIRDCKNLSLALSRLPMLSALEIRSCKEVDFRMKEDFDSLKMVVLFDISSITNMGVAFIQRLKKFKKLSVSSSNHAIVGIPSSLKKSHYYEDISTLECDIVSCPQIMSMMVDEDKEQTQIDLTGSDLECVALEGCERVPAWIQKLEFLCELSINGIDGAFSNMIVFNIHSLQELIIEHCDSLISFGTRKLSPSLKKLRISNCHNLTSIILEDNLSSSLQSLIITYCDKLQSIVEKFNHNTSLKTLYILFCGSLKSLPEGLQNLCEFEISHCKSIISFPQGGLPAKYLRKLRIEFLESLNALPDNIHTLSSLQELFINECPSLEWFPSQGLPSNLTTLTIMESNISKEMLERGLDRLNSLQELEIGGGCGEMVSFPPDETGLMLPSSLTSLTIYDFPDLKLLSTRGFQNLTSLQFLKLWTCPKLRSFPENGLPDSLLELEVDACPKLKMRCREGEGPEWSKICNIPSVNIYTNFWQSLHAE